MRLMQRKPLARSEGLLVEHVGDETVVYDSVNKQAHCLGPLAAVVYAECDGHSSIEKLAKLSSDRLERTVTSDDIHDALAQLQLRGLMTTIGSENGVSRRDFMRRSAVVGGAAMSAPLVTSILAPTPAAAVTGGCGEIACCPCYQNVSETAGTVPTFSQDPTKNGGPAGPAYSGGGQSCCEGLRGQPDTKTNCNCVNAATATPPQLACGKQCKSSGPALSEENCHALFPSGQFPIPANADTLCRCYPCTEDKS